MKLTQVFIAETQPNPTKKTRRNVSKRFLKKNTKNSTSKLTQESRYPIEIGGNLQKKIQVRNRNEALQEKKKLQGRSSKRITYKKEKTPWSKSESKYLQKNKNPRSKPKSKLYKKKKIQVRSRDEEPTKIKKNFQSPKSKRRTYKKKFQSPGRS